MDVDEDDPRQELQWRVVPVAGLPFPHHLFKCPLEEEHKRMLVEAGGVPECRSTAEERRRAFELFVTRFSDRIDTCPYHQPDWRLAAEMASAAVDATGQDQDWFDVLETSGLDRETEWAVWESGYEPIWIDGDRLGNGQHRVCAMKVARTVRCPIEYS